MLYLKGIGCIFFLIINSHKNWVEVFKLIVFNSNRVYIKRVNNYFLIINLQPPAATKLYPKKNKIWPEINTFFLIQDNKDNSLSQTGRQTDNKKCC